AANGLMRRQVLARPMSFRVPRSPFRVDAPERAARNQRGMWNVEPRKTATNAALLRALLIVRREHEERVLRRLAVFAHRAVAELDDETLAFALGRGAEQQTEQTIVERAREIG